MLERVLEPEVMDSPEEALDYDRMDHSQVNRLFVSDLLAAVAEQGLQLDEVLDLGTGTAQIPIELCQQHDTARVLAVDAAPSMLDVARNNIEVYGLYGERILLDLVDAKVLPYEDGRFGCVMSNSIVHHVPEPQQVLSETWRVTASGGLLFFRDLLRPDSQEELQHLVETYAGDCNEHQRQMFADSLHAALTVREVQELVERIGGNGSDVRQSSDRHWTWIGRKA